MKQNCLGIHKMYFLLGIIFSLLHFFNLFGLESRDSDPASIIENVSTIYGDYSEYEIDLSVLGPDPLILSRYYTSKDRASLGYLGGWRFYPHCFLTLQKDPNGRTYTTSEGKFDKVLVSVGISEGSVLTYMGWQNASNPKAKQLFKIDEEMMRGVSNSARGVINASTNLQNNHLYFENDRFELLLSNGGKRHYIKNPYLDLYVLEKEVLPSGNKIFYQYDTHSRPISIEMTNGSEKKVLSWIKIDYGSTIHIESSDNQTVDYQIENNCLIKAIRSHQPSIQYHYAIFNGKTLLIKKELPEGRFVEIEYYPNKKVKTVTNSTGIDGSASTEFIYENGFTEIYNPIGQKIVHRFNKELQLVSLEQYLGESLYRVQKKIWGDGKDKTNLISSTIEDGAGNIYYIKTLAYDDKNNVVKEQEYGNLTGASPLPILLDEDGVPEASSEVHTKTYIYSIFDQFDVITQKDAKGNGMKLIYKQGTNLLLKKFILEKETRKKRWFYEYNEDSALTQIIVDDGDAVDSKSTSCVHERLITQITPKKNIPSVGAPEVIEEKYLDIKSKKEILLKKTINHFDLEGNVFAQEVYDANGEHRYTLKKIYENGLITMESDPIGNQTVYSYDENRNLTSTVHLTTGTSFEYKYDLKNRLIYTVEKDNQGNIFETQASYNPFGGKLFEVDKFGNETVYSYDELGRLQSISYPETSSFTKPTYIYEYDLFDHVIAITDPNRNTITKAYTLRGQPTKIVYPDGVEERFKYDVEGSLHRHLSKDGTVRVFEYDYLGRLDHIERYTKSSKEPGGWHSSFRYYYNAFHKTSEKDQENNTTNYVYDGAGRITSISKDSKKTEFFYDALGRIKAVKKWKTPTTFIWEIKKYDLLNNVIEERVEDHNGDLILKYKHVYNEVGLLKEVIGYPQNQESILKSYDYDGFGRLIAIQDAFNQTTNIIYDDTYVNHIGQKVLKRIEIDPAGNQKEEIFDPAGHLAKVVRKNELGHILSESEFAYDLTGNLLLEKTAGIFLGEHQNTYIQEYTYGANNRLAAIKYAFATSSERTASFTYNSFGELSTKLGSGSKTPIIYEYGKDGKLSALSYQEFTHKFSYDKKGNLKETRTDRNHSIAYKFDPNDQLISESIQDEFGSYYVNYKLDGDGSVRSIQLPDGSFIQYDYKGPFVTKISRLTKDKAELYSHRIISRDLMGNALEEILINHAGARTQEWDMSGQRTRIVTDFFQDKIPEAGYDALKNIKQREITFDDEKYNIEYSYDDLSHLISETEENRKNYLFDSLSNRLFKDQSPYKINELNQILEADGVIYTFDLNGNLASKTINDKTWIFQYNPLNQLVSIQDPDQVIISFNYDLNGKRLSKKIEMKGRKAKIFRYFYIGQTELGVLDEKGTIIELRIPSNPNNPERAPFIAFELRKKIYAPIYDLQGNVACLIDPDHRKIIESYRYTAFGEVINGIDSQAGNPWNYLGKRADVEIGLIYFGHRYYDPEIGRWISPDPAGNIDGPNLYAFCRNNPLAYTDHFGLASESNTKRVDEKYFYGEYEPHCFCERHRSCKRGGDIREANSNFPTIIYDDYFEKYYNDYHSPDLFLKNYYENSTYYDLSEKELPNLPPDLGIGFINGVWNDFKSSKASAEYISKLSGGYNIHVIYNATHGTGVDVLECCLGLNYIATGPVRQLHEMWNDFFKNSSLTAKFLMICHSQGAIHVRNALLGYPRELRSRILVIAIAPGAYIYQKTCSDVFHYRAEAHRDFIPRLDLSGSRREANTIFTLDSHFNAPFFDHAFMSPTYKEMLMEHIRNYMLNNGDQL